jgi:hypothetical protein
LTPASGALAARPALDQVLDQLRPGDTLVVWNWTGSADPCATWSTSSLTWPTAASGSEASTLGVSRTSIYRHLGDLEG